MSPCAGAPTALALDVVLREHLGALEHVLQRQQHLAQVDRRRQLVTTVRSVTSARGRQHVAIQPARASMSSAACLKRSYSCRRRTSSARGSSSSLVLHRRTRQQHARLDLGQDRGHHQVLGGELEAHLVHRLDVLDVLARDLGDRDVEDVQVLAADQVQQQVERTFERLEDDLERVRRDVEVARQLGDRLAFARRRTASPPASARPCRRRAGGGVAGTKRRFGFVGFAASSLKSDPGWLRKRNP